MRRGLQGLASAINTEGGALPGGGAAIPNGFREALLSVPKGWAMGRGPATFKQRDVKAAVKAVAGAGCNVIRVEIDKNGKIVILTGNAQAQDQSPNNEWDSLIDPRAA